MSGGGSSARYLQFDKNVAHVPVDCTRANSKRFCNFAIGLTCCQQVQDFSFPISKLALGSRHRLFSLYVKLRTSPLDTGLEQGYTCSRQLLKVPGKVYFLHPARPIKKARASLVPFLN